MDYPANPLIPGKPDKLEKPVIPVVVTSGVRRQKPSLTKRFVATFFGGDARGALVYVVAEVLVPAAKDMLIDAVQQGSEKIVYGESRRANHGPLSLYKRASMMGIVPRQSPYGNISLPGPSFMGYQQNSPRNTDTSTRALANDVSEFVLETRVEAEEVITQMFELLSKYNTVTVADLLDMLGERASHTDLKWGWTDLRGSKVSKTRSGFCLDLPKAEYLD